MCACEARVCAREKDKGARAERERDAHRRGLKKWRGESGERRKEELKREKREVERVIERGKGERAKGRERERSRCLRHADVPRYCTPAVGCGLHSNKMWQPHAGHILEVGILNTHLPASFSTAVLLVNTLMLHSPNFQLLKHLNRQNKKQLAQNLFK